MIAEDGNGITLRSQHVFGESLESFLRPNFHEHARTCGVQRAQALDELHWRRHLLREDIEHLRHHVRACGIELTINVGDDRQSWRLETETLQHPPQRLTGGSDDGSVESVTH